MTSLLNKNLDFEDLLDFEDQDLDQLLEDIGDDDEDNQPDYYNEDSNRAEFGDIECIECDNLGEIVDVFDIAYEDLEDVAVKLSGKAKVKAVPKPKLKISVKKPTIQAKVAAKAVGQVAKPKLTIKAVAKPKVSLPKISAKLATIKIPTISGKVSVKPKIKAKVQVKAKAKVKAKPKVQIKAKGADHFIAKVKAKSPKVTAKHVEKLHAAIADRKVESIRKKKALPKKRPAQSVAIIPKTSEQAICLGTTMTPKQIIDIVKNKYKKHSKQVIDQAKRCAASLTVHKAAGTAKKLHKAPAALKNVTKKVSILKTTAHSDTALRAACGMP